MTVLYCILSALAGALIEAVCIALWTHDMLLLGVLGATAFSIAVVIVLCYLADGIMNN